MVRNPEPQRASEVRDLARLPKAELHLHLLGAMRKATLIELAAEAGSLAPDPHAFTTFAEFEAIYRAASAATQTRPANLLRLIREVIADAAADGVVWVQPHFDPHVYPAYGPPDEVMEMVLTEARTAGTQHGVGFGVTISAMRHQGPEIAENRAQFAARWAGRGAHALGLTGDEAAFPSEPFTRAFAIAREAGLEAAPHAGELAGPDSVRAAVDKLGATRLAHGIRAAEDAALMRDLAQRGITLDVSLTSNVRLGVVQDITKHPLPKLLNAGVQCSLSADDPLMFGIRVLDEYQLARNALNLDDQQLAELARTSIASSSAPTRLKATAMSDINAWLAT